MHDPNVILLGSTQSSVKDVTCELGDPTTFKAGLAVRLATTGKLQLNDDGTAVLIGVSLGEDLSGTKGMTAVCRTGNWVPLVLKNDAAAIKLGTITFTSKRFGAAGNALTITIADTEDGNVADVSVAVNGNDIILGVDAGVTTNAVLKAAIDSSPAVSALISAVIDGGANGSFVAAAVKTSLTGGSDFAAEGQPVLIDDASGQGSVDGDPTGAIYLSGVKTGLYPDGSTVPAAWIAMQGGF